MKDRKILLNTILAVELAVIFLACVLLRVFIPRMVFVKLDIPMMVAISLIALIIEYYMAPKGKRCYLCTGIFGAITFGVFPYVTAFESLSEMWKLGLVGGVVLVIVTWLYSSIIERLSSGERARLAPILSAVGLYLAFQCFAGIIL